MGSGAGGRPSGNEGETAEARDTKRAKYTEGGSLAQYERQKAPDKQAGEP